MLRSEKHILIVDDIQENVRILATILKNEGYKLAVAFSGKEALKILDVSEIDLILLDVMMPQMDGFSVCEIIKQNEKIMDIPIIFITALTEEDSIVRGFEVGGADYITKPFKKRELLARVTTHLELFDSKQKIERQSVELRHTISSRDKLYSIIGHDLRSPLATIHMMLTALQKKDLSRDDFTNLVAMLTQTTNDTFELLENLLYWSRNQLGDLVPWKSPVSLKFLVSENVNVLKANAARKSIELYSDVKDDVIIQADKNMMKTVVRNLISNAIKFTRSGGRVMVESEKCERWAKISITDTGIGIPEEKLDNLFDNKINQTTTGTNDEKGSGLGLKVCHDFVSKHDGQIIVNSKIGEGSTFTILLPTI